MSFATLTEQRSSETKKGNKISAAARCANGYFIALRINSSNI